MSASKHATKVHALHAISSSFNLVSAAKKNNNLFVEHPLLHAKMFAEKNLTVKNTHVRKFATQANARLAVATQAVCFTVPQVTTKLRS
jgi:hypothetical protein